MPPYRQSGAWMVIWDDRILEILSADGPHTPSRIAEHDGIYNSPSNISRRLSKLNEKNLVEGLGNGVYRITEKGELYLIGAFDAENNQVKLSDQLLIPKNKDEIYAPPSEEPELITDVESMKEFLRSSDLNLIKHK